MVFNLKYFGRKFFFPPPQGQMEVLDHLGELNTALVILSFLQEDHKSAEYRGELLSLAQHVSPPRAVELHGCPDASLDDGYLETDGSSPQIPPCLRGALPAVALPRPGELRDRAWVVCSFRFSRSLISVFS